MADESKCTYYDAARTSGAAYDKRGRRVEFRLLRGKKGRVGYIHAGDVVLHDRAVFPVYAENIDESAVFVEKTSR